MHGNQLVNQSINQERRNLGMMVAPPRKYHARAAPPARAMRKVRRKARRHLLHP